MAGRFWLLAVHPGGQFGSVAATRDHSLSTNADACLITKSVVCAPSSWQSPTILTGGSFPSDLGEKPEGQLWVESGHPRPPAFASRWTVSPGCLRPIAGHGSAAKLTKTMSSFHLSSCCLATLHSNKAGGIERKRMPIRY